MNTKYNELEEVYEVDLKNTSGAELLAIETPNKYVTYAGLERAVRNVLSKAKDYDKGLAGGYNGTFPLTAATKGNIYLLPATKKYYICIKDYSGSQLSAPNSNFEELSVYANRSKLDNLSKQIFKIKAEISVTGSDTVLKFTTPLSPYQTKILGIKYQREYLTLSYDIFPDGFWSSKVFVVKVNSVTDITSATMIAYKIY